MFKYVHTYNVLRILFVVNCAVKIRFITIIIIIENSQPEWCISSMISRVSNQNGVSLLYIMLEIHHSGREPLIYSTDIPF